MLKKLIAVGITFSALAALSFTIQDAQAFDHHEHAHMPTDGIVVLRPTKDNKVRGRLVLKETKSGLRVTGRVINLTPGEHGFHIHEFGDLSKPDGTAAGGHFNPDGHDHGGPGDDKHHAGDLGNIVAGDDGIAKVDITQKGLKLHFILGRSFVVHGGKDDLKSQPSGAAGPRVAVGVVGIAQPKKK